MVLLSAADRARVRRGAERPEPGYSVAALMILVLGFILAGLVGVLLAFGLVLVFSFAGQSHEM